MLNWLMISHIVLVLIILAAPLGCATKENLMDARRMTSLCPCRFLQHGSSTAVQSL